MKTKILITFLAIFFLATGSALALPVDLTYTVSQTEGGYILDFTVYNNTPAELYKDVYLFGVDVGMYYDDPNDECRITNEVFPTITMTNTSLGSANQKLHIRHVFMISTNSLRLVSRVRL